MKKIYISPTVNERKIQVQTMLAGSGENSVGFSNNQYNNSNALSKGGSFSFIEYDDDDNK